MSSKKRKIIHKMQQKRQSWITTWSENIPMAHFDSSSLRWCHQPTAIPMAILALDSICQTLMVYMISMMWVPYWNTTLSTVDNLCWCLFNSTTKYTDTRTRTHFRHHCRYMWQINWKPTTANQTLFTLAPNIILIALLTLVLSLPMRFFMSSNCWFFVSFPEN